MTRYTRNNKGIEYIEYHAKTACFDTNTIIYQGQGHVWYYIN